MPPSPKRNYKIYGLVYATEDINGPVKLLINEEGVKKWVPSERVASNAIQDYVDYLETKRSIWLNRLEEIMDEASEESLVESSSDEEISLEEELPAKILKQSPLTPKKNSAAPLTPKSPQSGSLKQEETASPFPRLRLSGQFLSKMKSFVFGAGQPSEPSALPIQIVERESPPPSSPGPQTQMY